MNFEKNLICSDIPAAALLPSKEIEPRKAGKFGLRNRQATVQQANIVQANTVCTLGPSYRLMKGNSLRDAGCRGRIELSADIKETINDTWSSYPSWSSEENTTQAVKKSNLEEFYTKTEDERYEVLEIYINIR